LLSLVAQAACLLRRVARSLSLSFEPELVSELFIVPSVSSWVHTNTCKKYGVTSSRT